MVSDGLFDFKFRSICCYGICFTFYKSKKGDTRRPMNLKDLFDPSHYFFNRFA